MAEKSYVVISPVKHGGKRFEVGRTIELDDAAAAPLVEAGVLGESPEEKPAAKKEAAPKKEAGAE